MSTFDVRFWDIGKRDRTLPWEVRWVVAGRVKSRSFATKALADGFRSRLVKAARDGEPFDEKTGLPERLAAAKNTRNWYDHARAYVEMKWPHAAAKSRRSMAEALATVTPALVGRAQGAPKPEVLRKALYGWAFNPPARSTAMPAEVEAALRWIEKASLPITELADSAVIRQALDACARTTTGKAAAATTARRKRAVFYNALGYAVELELLAANPIDKVQWKAQGVSATVDRRVVANPTQARALLAAVRSQGDNGRKLVGFFACLYFAGLRPSEAAALEESSCQLPAEGWGRLILTSSEPEAGTQWTDDGRLKERRGLKRRGHNEVRPVPIPPELVAILRGHIDEFGVADDGRLFRTDRGGPLQATQYLRVWHRAREKALTKSQLASPLARRPYDLRHAAVSLWLNSGVPATEVARRAGHGVAVMLAVYANCIDGQEQLVNDRIQEALGEPEEPAADRAKLDSASGSPEATPAADREPVASQDPGKPIGEEENRR